MVKETVEITKREYNFILDDIGRLVSYGQYIAIDKGYNPAGYGFYSPRIYKNNERHYFSWEREKSCD